MVQIHPFGHIFDQNNFVIPYPRTWLDIDLGALSSNIEVIRDHIGGEGEIALVCKADAYGHGLLPVGRFAIQNGANWLAVATVQEGIALRDAGIDARILVMSPILDVEFDQAIFYNFDLFVENRDALIACSKSALKLKRIAHLHLKVDTGLHRFGCSPTIACELLRFASGLEAIRVVGIAHHFVDSAFDFEKTQKQRKQFGQLLEELKNSGICPEIVHEANSAGAWQFGSKRGNLVRIGIMAYGVDPAGLSNGKLTPVMRWFARLTSLRNVQKGETLSYSSTYRLEKDSLIATLGIGYGDGYPRTLSSKGYVLIRGVRCPVVGLVCMDQTLVDVSNVPEAKIGDVAEMLGENISVAELARLSNTNSHEILTRVMSRVSRRYIYP